jgi:hypothetical protein
MARQYLDLAQVYGAVDQSRANQAAMENNRLQNERYQRQIAREDAELARQEGIRGIYKGAIEIGEDGSPKLNEKRLITDLYGMAPEQALSVQEGFTKRDAEAAKMQRENQKAELADKIERIKAAKDIVATTYDQNSYNQARQMLSQIAPDLPMPEQWTPEWKENTVMTGEGFLKKAEAELNRGVTMRGQDITMRGQDMTDKRAREEGAANRSVSLRGQNLTDVRAREKNAIDAAAGGYSTKPLPATALKMQNEGLEKLAIASNNNAELGQVLNQINEGKLNLGLASNLEGAARNYTGFSNESSRNLSSFKSKLEKLRNDSLRLNTGVQTDGDAQRAWNELFENINDQELVKQRLGEIQKINARGADLQKLQVENIRGNYNAAPIDFTKYEVKTPVTTATQSPKTTGQKTLATVKSDNDYAKLPKGTRFKAPDGSIRVKP